MVPQRGQGRSDRLLLVSPPRAQPSLLAPLSSSFDGLPAWFHLVDLDVYVIVVVVDVDVGVDVIVVIVVVLVVASDAKLAKSPSDMSTTMLRTNCARALDGQQLLAIEGSEKC